MNNIGIRHLLQALLTISLSGFGGSRCYGLGVEEMRGEYLDVAPGLGVKVLGHSIMVFPQYYGKQWEFNIETGSLKFERQVNRAGETQLLAIVVGASSGPGTRYESKSGTASIYWPEDFDGDAAPSDYIEATSNGYKNVGKLGIWAQYDPQGKIQSYGKSNNRKVTVLYENGLISGFRDTFGDQVLWITRQNGRIVQVSEAPSTGRTVRYKYDSRGNLTNAVDVLGYTTSWFYDSANRIVKKIGADGTQITMTYHSSGRVKTYTDITGLVRTYSYGFNKNEAIYSTTIQDDKGTITEKKFSADGKMLYSAVNGVADDLTGPVNSAMSSGAADASFEADAEGNLTAVTYADGTQEHTEYNGPFGEATRAIGRDGIVTETAYDSQGNITQMVRAVGMPFEVKNRYTYDEYGRCQTMEIIRANRSPLFFRMTWDQAGNMLTKTDGNGILLVSNDYNRLGSPVRSVNEHGVVTYIDRNGVGQIVAASNSVGDRREIMRDSLFRKTIEHDGAGGQMEFERDSYWRLTSVSNSLGLCSKLEYDNDGNVVRRVDQSGRVTEIERDYLNGILRIGDGKTKAISIKYDSQGREIESIDVEGNKVTTTYDGQSERPRRIVRATQETQYRYDSQGRMREMRSLLPDQVIVNSCFFNGSGQMTDTWDGEGRNTHFDYNDFGQVSRTINSAGETKSVSYDGRMNAITKSNSRGASTRCEYNENGQPAKIIWPDGKCTAYEYDVSGRMIGRVNPDGSRVRFAFNAMGQMIGAEAFESTNSASPSQQMDFSYDQDRNAASWDNGEVRCESTYDATNRRLSVVYDFGAFQRQYACTFDVDGRPVAFEYPDHSTNTYHYDDYGQLTGIEVPSLGTVSYRHRLGRVEQAILPGGTVQTLSYNPIFGMVSNVVLDPAGNERMRVVNKLNKVGYPIECSTDDGTYAFEYDGMDRLSRISEPQGGESTYSYDGAGNRVAGPGTNETWQYNLMDQLTNSSSGTCQYDDNGNIVASTVGGETRHYEYDLWGNLACVKDADGDVIASYTYGSDGNRLSKTVAGVRTWYLHGPSGLLAEYDAQGNELALYGRSAFGEWNCPLYLKLGSQYYLYIYDAPYSPKMLMDLNGAVVWHGPWRWTEGEAPSGQITNNLMYSGQYYDQETKLFYNTRRYYDPAMGRYISRDPIAGVNGGNAYAMAGDSRIGKADPLGLAEKPIHYDLMRKLALDAGFRADVAEAIAQRSQQMDEGLHQPQFCYARGWLQEQRNALASKVTGLPPDFFSGGIDEAMKDHMVLQDGAVVRDSKLVNDNVQQAMKTGVMAFGDSMHPFVDTYYHEGARGKHGTSFKVDNPMLFNRLDDESLTSDQQKKLIQYYRDQNLYGTDPMFNDDNEDPGARNWQQDMGKGRSTACAKRTYELLIEMRSKVPPSMLVHPPKEYQAEENKQFMEAHGKDLMKETWAEGAYPAVIKGLRGAMFELGLIDERDVTRYDEIDNLIGPSFTAPFMARALDASEWISHTYNDAADVVSKAYDESAAAASSAYDDVSKGAGEWYDAAGVVASDTYKSACDGAGAAYEASVAAAEAAYGGVGEAYDAAVAAAGETYDAALAAAGMAYDTAGAAAEDTYNAARAAYESARDSAGVAYDAAVAAAEAAYGGAGEAYDAAVAAAGETYDAALDVAGTAYNAAGAAYDAADDAVAEAYDTALATAEAAYNAAGAVYDDANAAAETAYNAAVAAAEEAYGGAGAAYDAAVAAAETAYDAATGAAAEAYDAGGELYHDAVAAAGGWYDAASSGAGAAYDTAVAAAESAYDAVAGVAAETYNAASEAHDSARGAAESVYNAAVAAAAEAYGGVGAEYDAAVAAAAEAYNAAVGVADEAYGGAGAAYDAAVAAAESAYTDALNAAEEAYDGAGEWYAAAGDVANDAWSAVEEAYDAAGDVADWLTDGASAVVSGARTGITGATDWLYNLVCVPRKK